MQKCKIAEMQWGCTIVIWRLVHSDFKLQWDYREEIFYP